MILEIYILFLDIFLIDSNCKLLFSGMWDKLSFSWLTNKLNNKNIKNIINIDKYRYNRNIIK